jgi:hypothetical protein
MVESAKLYAKGVLKRLYWLAPTLFLDPFDIAERYFGIMYSPPYWLMWVLMTVGFLIAGGLTYHELRGEKIKQDAKLDLRERNRKLREVLGIYLNEGQVLLRQCLNQKMAPPRDKANDWVKKVEQTLETELNGSYVSRFRSEAGLTQIAIDIQSVYHRDLYGWIHIRLSRLTQMITELSCQQ